MKGSKLIPALNLRTVENFILNKIDGMSMHDGHLGFAFFSFLEIIQ
jgi:hypothetical protein